jgi:hypothetical protein
LKNAPTFALNDGKKVLGLLELKVGWGAEPKAASSPISTVGPPRTWHFLVCTVSLQGRERIMDKDTSANERPMEVPREERALA